MNKKLRRLPDWIEDIRGAIKNIREDIKGLTKGQFLDTNTPKSSLTTTRLKSQTSS